MAATSNRHALRHVMDIAADTLRAAEGHRIDQGKHLREHLDAALQGVFEQFLLGRHQAVLRQSRGQGLAQSLLVAGLGQEAKDVPFVDRAHGALDIGVAGQHDANRVRSAQPDLSEQAGSIYLRHAHVRDHHRVGPGGFKRTQGRQSPGRGIDLKFISEYALVTRQDAVFIVDH
jgi:hypothetical protein